ncbi:MAG: zinc-ribbon domain-containing protein [Methanobacteriota archaeon]
MDPTLAAWVSDLTLTLLVMAGGLAVTVFVLWMWSRSKGGGGRGPPCPQCGAGLEPSWDFCPRCGASAPKTASEAPDEVHYSVRRSETVRYRPPPEAPRFAASRRVYRFALTVMLVGLLARATALLGIAVLPEWPQRILGFVTIVAGIVAFIGFALLDSA